MFFWQDLGKLLWKLFKTVIILSGIFFFCLIIYFRPDMYVKNIFQDLKKLKIARESFEEKNEKIIDEIKKLKKQKEIVENKENALNSQLKNLEKRISKLEEEKEEKKKEEEEKKEEKDLMLK